MQKEIWRPVKGYEKYYQVSNLGRVKSLDRMSEWNGNYRRCKGRVLAHGLTSGYVAVSFCVEKKKTTKKIHRLVAVAFIPSVPNKREVNHINGDKADNRAENLEWMTRSENMLHAYAMKRKRLSISK